MFQPIKSKILQSIKSKKINLFLLFIVLSFLFLILTKLTKDYTKTITFTIRTINEKENHILLKDSTHKFDITLSTYGFKFLKYYLTNPKVTVNLNNLDNINNTYIWTSNNGMAHLNSQFKTDINIIAVSPDSIVFNYDINHIKKVPIQLNANITFMPGYDVLNNYSLDPDSLKIIGPKILLDTINVVHTKPLNLVGVNSNIKENVKIILPDSSQNIMYSLQKTTVKGTVEKFSEGTVEVPIDVINVPQKIKLNYFPKTINVMYYTSLSNFNKVKSKDFIVECNYNDLTDESTYLEPKLIKWPSNIKNLKLSKKQVEFIISK